MDKGLSRREDVCCVSGDGVIDFCRRTTAIGLVHFLETDVAGALGTHFPVAIPLQDVYYEDKRTGCR